MQVKYVSRSSGRRRPTQSVRDRLLAPGSRCAFCGTRHNLTIDHIIPRALGGTGRQSNLQVLCKSCNQRKGSDPLFGAHRHNARRAWERAYEAAKTGR